MFPTFISILDIQSWWEVPSIAHFCSLFRSAFNLLDFDIEDLEEALLTDGTEETSWLQELIVRLLSGCLPNNEISTFNYQMFLRRLFRQKCQEHDQYNPFNTDVDFQILPLRTKVDILHALCDFRLDADDVLDQLKNLEPDSLRVEPLGYDSNDSAYWYFYGTRLYREDYKNKAANKQQSVWQVVCFTEDDWFQLSKKFKKSPSKAEKQLYKTLSENFLPELHRLFSEKERLARKRLLENCPRRTSDRIRKLELTVEREREEEVKTEKPEVVIEEDDELKRKHALEKRRREAYERRSKLREESEATSEDSVKEESDVDTTKQDKSYEMAKGRGKKSKIKQSQKAGGETTKKDKYSSKSKKGTKKNDKSSQKDNSAIATTTKVGRQTNNSLSAATGQIVIEPKVSSHKKKLKTHQVFRQTDEDLQTGMHKILDHVKNHEDAWPFVDPVEEEYAPNYYSVIRKPMDLQRMEERLDSGYYKTFSKFRTDFQLIVDNCRLYNGAENEYTEMVDNLLQVFERATEKYLDQISSSEDEIAVEFPESDADSKNATKSKKTKTKAEPPKASKRKPTLMAKTDRKRERSPSEEPILDSDIEESDTENLDKEEKVEKRGRKSKHSSKTIKKEKKKVEEPPPAKKRKHEKKEKEKEKSSKEKTLKHSKNVKERKASKSSKKLREKSASPIRERSRSRSPSRTRYSSSPPLSWPPSSPEPGILVSSKTYQEEHVFEREKEDYNKANQKAKQKEDRWKELFENEEITNRIENKITTLEERPSPQPKPKDKHVKLRETIEKLKAKSEISHKLTEIEFSFNHLDTPKENHHKSKSEKHTKQDKHSTKSKDKHQGKLKNINFDDQNKDMNIITEKSDSKKNSSNKPMNTNNSNVEALSLATEQTLKDISKWLDDTPKLSEFSSASNSPSYTTLDELDMIANKTEDPPKKVDKLPQKKDGVKEVKKKPFRDPTKFFKRREVQRTIDRLQPGKSKGNLISNVQNSNKADEIFPLGPLSKLKDTKNSLIVKTDENAPKLSLGSVLDSFGKHKFVDDQKKEEVQESKKEEDQLDVKVVESKKEEVKTVENIETASKIAVGPEEPAVANIGGATPNLSAWFKAFGAPKIQPVAKKSDAKSEVKEEEPKKEETRKVAIPDQSPNPDSPLPGQPIPRQRKISTGSSVSERSSFSQDMDSPRVGIDERLGSYPAPYPSPLHRSPSGASPIMASPRPDVSPKAAYPAAFNGQIRVGFYQDTVSTKSSPEKSCSPKENPQSPHPQYSEHVYTDNMSQSVNYGYPNSPYSHASYSNASPKNMAFYDTNKSLIDQYQAKSQSYVRHSPASNVSSPVSAPQHSPSIETFHSDDPRAMEKIPVQSTMFPVKKRVYTDAESNQNNLENSRYNSELNNASEYMKKLQEESKLAERSIPEQNTTVPQVPQYNKPYLSDPKAALDQYNVGNLTVQQTSDANLRNVQQYIHHSSPYVTGYGGNETYPLNIPTTGRTLTNMQEAERKMDMSKFTNMGYNGPEVGFSRNIQQYNRPQLYDSHPVTSTSTSQNQQHTTPVYTSQNNERCVNPSASATTMPYKSTNHNTSTVSHQPPKPSTTQPSTTYKPPDISVPRPPTYNTLEMPSEPLALRGNIANTLSHHLDRYGSDERMLTGLPSGYYDKGLANAAHMFSKPNVNATGSLPMFSQAGMGLGYGGGVPVSSGGNVSGGMYNRQMPIQNSGAVQVGDGKGLIQQGTVEKKSKKRKSSKAASVIATPDQQPPTPGFQSYSTIKPPSTTTEPPISLKTSSPLPGSAFNFGPSLHSIPPTSALYTDSNFLDDFRATPNYYMAAHHRATPDRPGDKPQPANYPLVGGQGRQGYGPPLGGFINPASQQLMDPSSPIYQHYLQAGVINQGLLGPPGAYPAGYHPLSMRQPYDSIQRPTWL